MTTENEKSKNLVRAQRETYSFSGEAFVSGIAPCIFEFNNMY